MFFHLWLQLFYNFVLQAIQNEREIESLRKKLTFCLEAKENLERYTFCPALACCLLGFFTINQYVSFFHSLLRYLCNYAFRDG
jgi:hypothetical protein